ncbi:MurR/RpiR family transcriptional regulator [Oscillospiraceae bacterium PP1C4]
MYNKQRYIMARGKRVSAIMEQYGLGVMLYSFLNEEEISSPYYIIAKYLLENMDGIKSYSIKEFSEKCNVSIATISRFCRKAGLENFFELKMILHSNYLTSKPEYSFKTFSDVPDSICHAYLDSVIENIRLLKKRLDYCIIEELVDDLHSYPRIGAFGAMHMENTARALQYDLFRCRKIINIRSSMPKQLEYIKSSTENDVIIIFTLSGNYLKELQMNAPDWENGHKPKIYVVTGNQKASLSPYVNRAILVPSPEHDFAAHPYGMSLISSLISLQYYDKYIK